MQQSKDKYTSKIYLYSFIFDGECFANFFFKLSRILIIKKKNT